MVIRTLPRNMSGFSRYQDASDMQLLSVASQGDDRALDTLMCRYRGLIYRVVKTYLGTLTDAEDMYQEIYLLLHQNPQTYKLGSAKFSSWLHRVTANKCLDILKSVKSSQKHQELSDAIPDQNKTAEDQIQSSQLQEKLLDLLKSLPEQQRAAVSYFYCDGMDVNEIAKRLDVTDLAVRSLIKRGKEKLRNSSEIETYRTV